MPEFQLPGSHRKIDCDYTTSEITASGVLVAEPCILRGIVFRTDGTNDITLVGLFDNDIAPSGDILLPSNIVIDGSNNAWGWNFGPRGPLCSNGVYVSFTIGGGGTAAMLAYYDK